MSRSGFVASCHRLIVVARVPRIINNTFAIGFISAKNKMGSYTMSASEEAEKLLASMTRGEKARLLQIVARDLGDAFPGIDSNPLICGGEPCIIRTRIPVWVLEQARRLGVSEAELLRSYPTLRAEDVANAWAYVRAHHDEIDEQISENEAA